MMKTIYICHQCGSLHYQDNFRCENCGEPLDQAYEAQVSEADFNSMKSAQMLMAGK